MRPALNTAFSETKELSDLYLEIKWHETKLEIKANAIFGQLWMRDSGAAAAAAAKLHLIDVSIKFGVRIPNGAN